jgi:hypothetical protein
MQEDREKWIELCERAADEQDPRKLATLISEINCMLEAKERRLLAVANSGRPSKITRHCGHRHYRDSREATPPYTLFESELHHYG